MGWKRSGMRLQGREETAAESYLQPLLLFNSFLKGGSTLKPPSQPRKYKFYSIPYKKKPLEMRKNGGG